MLAGKGQKDDELKAGGEKYYATEDKSGDGNCVLSYVNKKKMEILMQEQERYGGDERKQKANGERSLTNVDALQDASLRTEGNVLAHKNIAISLICTITTNAMEIDYEVDHDISMQASNLLAHLNGPQQSYSKKAKEGHLRRNDEGIKGKRNNTSRRVRIGVTEQVILGLTRGFIKIG
ncbi:hypothetical protein E2542_SST25353 [Spatholobus suberectus]|nr:hypothetical protein E2542_SST25353 [Spatholobus suberectus]